MCVGIPGRIVEISDTNSNLAIVDVGGVRRRGRRFRQPGGRICNGDAGFRCAKRCTHPGSGGQSLL